MGASPSRPAASAPPALSEKQAPAAAAAAAPAAPAPTKPAHTHAHHSSDRALRIAAEAAQAPHAASAATPSLHPAALKQWRDEAMAQPETRLAALVLHNADLALSVRSRSAEQSVQHVFSHTVKLEGTPVTNQRNSGRCWLFAQCNVIRTQIMAQYDLDKFELSQSYLHFYDKLEKANTFLLNTIELHESALDDRVYGFLKGEPVNDGGQYDMVVNLLLRYGIVPKQTFPESFSSSASSRLNWLVTVKLREHALELRALLHSTKARLASLPQEQRDKAALAAALQRKEAQMKEIYKILLIALGEPLGPDDEFTWEYHDKAGKFHRRRFTPLSFLKSVKTFEPLAACSLVNDPRRGYNKLMSVDRLQNVWGARPVSYVNTTSQTLKDCVVKSIKAGYAVFFGCDVGKFSHSASGLMSTELFDYEAAFGTKLGLSKAERLDMGESMMTHAMVITGVSLDDAGKVQRYRVENSWGEDIGDRGYMVMSDAWFDQYTYQVVVRREFMPANLWDIFAAGVNKDTDVLPPYDPFATLA